MALGVCDFSVSGFSTHTALSAVSHRVWWDNPKVCTFVSAPSAGSTAWLLTSPTPGLHLVSTSCNGKGLPQGLSFSFPKQRMSLHLLLCEISLQEEA